MRVIPPVLITDDKIVSTTIAEPSPGEVAWSSGTTFQLGQKSTLGTISGTVTMAASSGLAGVVSWTAHNLQDDQPISFSGGTLPTELVSGKRYYVVSAQTNSFNIAAEVQGVPITFAAASSGTVTAAAPIHRAYESLQGSNTNHHPLLPASATWWIDVGPTNQRAMFDLYRNTRSQAPSPMVVEIAPGERVDSIGVLGIEADTVLIEVLVGATVVYTETISLISRIVIDWSSYFFAKFSTKPTVELIDLPPYTDAHIKVTLTRASGYISCGAIVIGRSIYIGQTQYGAVDDVNNFSRIERTEWGEAILVPRKNVPKVQQLVKIDPANIETVRAIRESLNAVPALWSGIDDVDSDFFESLLIMGIYKQFSINLEAKPIVTATLELEGV